MAVKPKLSTLRKRELIAIIERRDAFLLSHEIAMHRLMTDWQDDVPPHVRVRVMVELYEPLLSRMIDLGLLPTPRQ